MLIRFSVENFMSFKTRTDFYMSAGKATRHSNHLAEVGGKRVLKSAFLFGANASGKSNFVKAVEFAQDVVMMGLNEVNCDRVYFRVDEQYSSRPGVFQFDFLSNEKYYSYGFAISYKSASIEEEWLYEMGAKETCVFLRQIAEDRKSYTMESDLCKREDIDRLKIYLKDFKDLKQRHTMFMSDAASRAPDDDNTFEAFRDTVKWFSKLVIVFPSSRYNNIHKFVYDKKTDLQTLLGHFDTGVDSISTQEMDFEKLLSTLPDDLAEEIKRDMSGCLKDKNAHRTINIDNDRIQVLNKDGKLTASRVVLNHGNPNDLFTFDDESDGTRRLFDLIPIYSAALQDCVIFIDEIDRSFHTKLTQEFVDYYYKLTEGTFSQLIATTQDSNLMDLDILRQDEIWFVERKQDHSSILYSLNKFKARFDKKIEKDYLLGRYGGIPIFNQFDMLEQENEKKKGTDDHE